MFDNIENLEVISSLRRINKVSAKIENRSTHAFFFRIKGSIMYDFGDKSILSKEGDVMFIPQGATYSYRTFSENTTYTSIYFQGNFADTPRPTCYKLEDFRELDYIRNHFHDMWNFGTNADKYKCISLFYSLLSHISSTENFSYGEKKKFKIIDPAVEYLKNHIYDSSLTTANLHTLCGVSNTYFRKIFISRFGVTPSEYIITKRLSHAKSIIDSGEFDTIKELALSVGYNDPLYFGKAFRKMYGFPPSEA